MRNYPWYKEICKDYKNKAVVMIGIHTPETAAEKSVPNVRKALDKAGFTFPVAIDNKWTMWKRYKNGYWPSVYLIDKQGIVRWGWAGELAWKGAAGEALMRSRIDGLLRE